MATVTYTNLNGRTIAENRGGTRKYYSSDALGSTVALYDDSGSKTDSFKYWPYGETRTRTGSTPTKYKFVGTLGCREQADGCIYMGASVERPIEGRWLAPVNWGVAWNPYVFAENNPLRPAQVRLASKKKPVLTIIIGSNKKIENPVGLLERVWDLYYDHYRIVVVRAHDTFDVVDSISRSDALIMIGHGGPFSTGGGTMSVPVVEAAARFRCALGRCKMDFVRLYSCNCLSEPSEVGAWLDMSNGVYGFSGFCYPTLNPYPMDHDGGRWYIPTPVHLGLGQGGYCPVRCP